ncbi:hypothetical protein [Aquabacterium sp.]|uniref:SCO family protein n=1 Tax=Aquabacterium sp. TaxID=1872578 RepID=UPI0025BF4552|nr:hypothetical protein [Aquabacterium sp.]
MALRSTESPGSRTQPDTTLDFSVHGLPSAEALRAASGQRTRLGRLKMLGVLAVCAAPVVASYLSYYVFRPQGRVNHGEFIQPPRSMPAQGALGLTLPNGQRLPAEALKGQWLLVAVGGGACDALCERHLYWQRQLRETLGKDKDRLDRVWLVNDAAPVRAALWPGLQQAWVLRASPSALSGWLQPAPGHDLAEHLYLVDPRGDWMMRFPADADPNRIKKDLARLMKANESWDKAGR